MPLMMAYRHPMWLNQRTIDAIRIMAELAGCWPAPLRTNDLPARTGISLMNSRKTVNALAQAALLETARGRQGGARLARPPGAISIGEIVRAFEPRDCPVSFLVASTVDSGISALLFRAHRGFFAPLETTPLSALAARSPAPAPRRRLEA